MQERHLNRNIYFDEQVITTKQYVIPYISKVKQIKEGDYVLEVGCGEGGNLMPFYELGCYCFGVDLDNFRIEIAKSKLPHDHVTLLNQNIYDIDEHNFPQFDLIFLRDVIEHIHHQDQFISFIRKFLKPDGVIFFAFPPWRMPFGGHQQIAHHKYLSKLPFYHILPEKWYHYMLKKSKESEDTIQNLMEIKETRISIHRFQKIIKQNHFEIKKSTYWLINPNYEIKFHLKPHKLYFLKYIPFIKDFFTTCYYAVVVPDKEG
ncbi:MAG: class I SAM-dependent methyltransferase [Bacteroidales bacterium]|jgi:2-polyprenyl-3-methyl-5-hydroxy-6-metoxy-1,4-benzoquinol methylase|nr:class I SAM-dependent methyltransferase [Bacteroidales bacterium]